MDSESGTEGCATADGHLKVGQKGELLQDTESGTEGGATAEH